MIDPPVAARAASGRHFVVGVDGSLASHVALEWACAEADQRGLAVHVVTALPGSCALYPSGYGIVAYNDASDARHDAEALIADELSWARSRCPDLHLAGHAVKGDPRRVLRAMAARAESLVIGTSHVHPAAYRC